MILKQTLRNHIIVSWFTWFVTIILFGIWGFLDYDTDFLLVGGLFHLLFTIPAVYIHIEYTISNWGEEIEVNYNEIIIRKHGQIRSFNSNELERIIVYKPASLDKTGIPLSAMEYYYYARIISKKGEEIVITCLMTLELEEVLKKMSGVTFERKKRLAFLGWK